ncbi:hypothetical protein ZWY2020_041982 [Hordeum vulgare]|nr:hypothetical protein ZWY2020_041982 [Hordeum vulgare]
MRPRSRAAPLPRSGAPISATTATGCGRLAGAAASGQAFINATSGRMLPCIALQDAGKEESSGLVDQISGRTLPCVALKPLEQISGVLPSPPLECSTKHKVSALWGVVVAPFFPDDFLLTLYKPFQRDLVLESRSIEVAGVRFKFRSWLPPPGGSRVWRYYCRVAIERLPLTDWDWASVKEILGKDWWLDLIERQSTTKTNVKALFAWCWTWNPDRIPRASDFNVLNRPDVACPRGSRPEGTPMEEGKEGPHFPVLLHLDLVKDYAPNPDSPEHGAPPEWPRIYPFDGWRYGIKDGEGRSRSMGARPPHDGGRCSGDDEDGGGNGRPRGKRGGVRKRFLQSLRAQAQCKDTSSREPKPRRYHRRDEGATSGHAPMDVDCPTVGVLRMRGRSPMPRSTSVEPERQPGGFFVTPNL